MTNVVKVKVALLLIGVTAWGVGYRFDNSTFRWIGIAALLCSFLYRFSPASREERDARKGR